MSEITDWAGGKPCSRHDLAWCADCRDLAKMKRSADGTVSYQSDCAIQTFAEITGADYEEATSYLRLAGFRPGSGTPGIQIAKAFAAAGFTVFWSGLRIEEAVTASRTGRAFYVVGQKGRYGHAWSITGGKASRSLRPPFRYRIFEVTA